MNISTTSANCRFFAALLLILLYFAAMTVSAQTTAFTYQGRLTDGAMSANSTYDFQFALFDAQTGGNQIAVRTNTGLPVSNGTFTTQLDFGAGAFPGADRYLEIRVKRPNDGAYTTLLPRQQVTSTPYAIRAVSAGAADSLSAACVLCVTDSQINSISGAKVTGAVANATNADNAATAGNVTGVVAVANGGTGSSTKNFVDLTTNQTVDGAKTFTSAVNTSTQYNINGDRMLSRVGDSTYVGRNAGVNDIANAASAFFGWRAGASNTQGWGNSFFGAYTGHSNTTGTHNSFFGRYTGADNINGTSNSFFGNLAGRSNTTGNQNAFFGTGAGYNNTTGNNNTILGEAADVASGNLFFASAIGSRAVVSANDTIVIGKLPGTYNGIARPADSVIIPGTLFVGGVQITGAGGGGNYIQNTTTQQASSNFNISGNGTAGGTLSANIFNATTQYNIGGNRVLSIAGNANLFAGYKAGNSNTTGYNNAFVGNDAGLNNTTGYDNSFFGSLAGLNNTSGAENVFVGKHTGALNQTGNQNAFFGIGAGFSNQIGGNNAFFGTGAGNQNTTGSRNTMLGDFANVGAGNLNYATAIGAGATVSTSNTVVLGRPQDAVQVPGTLFVGGVQIIGGGNDPNVARTNTANTFTGDQTINGNLTVSGTASANIFNATTQYNIGGSRVLSIAGSNNLFAGYQAGLNNTTGIGNAFVGRDAGLNNTTGSKNAFFGTQAGNKNTTGYDNAFFGTNAGLNNSTGYRNTFTGIDVGGNNTTGIDNSFFGWQTA